MWNSRILHDSPILSSLKISPTTAPEREFILDSEWNRFYPAFWISTSHDVCNVPFFSMDRYSKCSLHKLGEAISPDNEGWSFGNVGCGGGRSHASSHWIMYQANSRMYSFYPMNVVSSANQTLSFHLPVRNDLTKPRFSNVGLHFQTDL